VASKTILSARSNYFKIMFNGKWAESSAKIIPISRL